MRIIPEHELAPDDNPCEDCNRIRVAPISITDDELNRIVEHYYVRTWKHIPFSQYMRELIALSQKV
jgi:hypothetical protein